MKVLVGVRRFELPAPASRRQCSNGLGSDLTKKFSAGSIYAATVTVPCYYLMNARRKCILLLDIDDRALSGMRRLPKIALVLWERGVLKDRPRRDRHSCGF